MRISILNERWTLRLIIITPLVAIAILTVVITSFYVDKLNYYFQENAARYLDEYVISEKRQGDAERCTDKGDQTSSQNTVLSTLKRV